MRKGKRAEGGGSAEGAVPGEGGGMHCRSGASQVMDTVAAVRRRLSGLRERQGPGTAVEGLWGRLG
jgi:hypothetical protein